MFSVMKFVSLAVFIQLVGCAQAELDKFDQGLKQFNQALGVPVKPGGNTVQPVAPMAVRGDESKSITTELVIPSDKATEEAMNAALPIVKKVMSMHQCMKSYESLRLLNFYAVNGGVGYMNSYESVPVLKTKYHDKSQCVDVKALDQWTLLAFNALRVRAVYFATDSGETFNMFYVFMKTIDGSWKLSQINTANY